MDFYKILNFLASWNWKEDPLVLDLVKSSADDDIKLSDKLTIQAHRIIEQNFEKLEKQTLQVLKHSILLDRKMTLLEYYGLII